jgi:hypothetical protein
VCVCVRARANRNVRSRTAVAAWLLHHLPCYVTRDVTSLYVKCQLVYICDKSVFHKQWLLARQADIQLGSADGGNAYCR